MERTETTILEVVPEKKQSAVKRQTEFGWTLVSAQEETKMSGGQTEKRVKLLFTRTASAEWIEDMKHLEKELAEHDGSVRFGTDGLVKVGEKPSGGIPIPILIVGAFAGFLVGWVAYDISGGILAGFLTAGGIGTFLFQQSQQKLAVHTLACRQATDIFKRKRREILVRIRAHVNTQQSTR